MRNIFVLVGLSCSGKDTVGKYISKKMNIKHYAASRYAKSLLLKDNVLRGVELSSEIDSKIRASGMDIVARKIFSEVESKEAVISGFRYYEELSYTQSREGKITLIYIDSDQSLRHKRSVLRNRKDVLHDIESFKRLDLKQVGYGLIDRAKCEADYYIENNSTFEDLYDQVNRIISS